MSDLIDYWGQKAFNYSTVAACAFVAWDISVSTGQEIDIIWRGSWTHLKSLYFFLRYGTLITQIVSVIVNAMFEAGVVFSNAACTGNIIWGTLAGIFIILGTQVVSMLRLRALYYYNKPLLYTLVVLYVGEVISMFVCFFLAVPFIEFGVECSTIYFPFVNIGYLISPVLFETLLFSLTMFRFYQSMRDGWGREPVVTRFMQDGIWVFFFPFVVLTAFLISSNLIKNAFSQLFWPWTQVIPGFVGYRLILNMSHLLKMHSREFADDIVVDTVPVPFGQDTYLEDCEPFPPVFLDHIDRDTSF